MEKRIESLLERVEKPARYIGGEVGSVVKQDYSLRVVLSYPDVYEIGTVNQAVQIIYSLINLHSNSWAERAYCPWPDLSALMRENSVPLFALESWEPVSGADLWGFTLQHELTYTNILEMLDLAGVPLHWQDRGDGDPLVFAGGPCASNPHPVAAFFDFILVGDGEQAVTQVLKICEEGKDLPRRQLLTQLAGLEGIFVPAFPRRVKRAVVAELDYSLAPVRPVIPSMGAVHDRATLEIMRGCTRGCRFCMAGNWYRPVRERPAGEVCRAIADLVAGTGYDEASLSSLSTTDYSCIQETLTSLAESQPRLTVSLPSLRVDPEAIRLVGLTSSRRSSITLAPEAGSQRLRDAINKQVSGEDIQSAIGEAFRGGCNTVKLYFMIGLPTETESDLQGIIDIATAARRTGRQEGANPGRVQINVSVASFVPKAHTPFQWGGMNGREELAAKHEFLRRNMPRKQIKLSLHDLEPGLVESAIARGRDETAVAIEAAWRAGSGFDAWTEKFSFTAWETGFAAIGSSIEREATRVFPVDAELPWDDIDSRVSKEFLLEEKERADRGEITLDCRQGSCENCGVCEGDIEMRIAKP
ncbi:MAG: TIGR03960 family B12-binding radical SAM protein [Thermoleophilia bacterium]